MAKTIFEHFQQKLAEYARAPAQHYPLRNSLRIVKVRLWETSTSWAEYWETEDAYAKI
jgi:6-pyruvoyltetrahydropterin/6-carboxytetrahydropterin synthase